MNTPRLIAGCMTGTSLDGLDTALAEVHGHGLAMTARYVAHVHHPLGDLAPELHHLAAGRPAQPIRYMQAARRLGDLYADAVETLCRQCLPTDTTLAAVVAHGQTIWHAPEHALSWQLFDPWPLVHRLRVPVCFDLRGSDLAAGGQGAPITPLADWVLYRHATSRGAVVNLGGICNITFLGGGSLEHVGGADAGPCNLLIDGVVQRLYPDRRYDMDGLIGRAGTPRPGFHARVAAHPFFGGAPGARSTGREVFSDRWLDDLVAGFRPTMAAADIVASATDTVARLIAGFIGRYEAAADIGAAEQLVLAGGGAHNALLVQRIAEHAPHQEVLLSDHSGIPCDAREAVGLAVLGALSQDGVPITLPAVTGAREPAAAGAWAGAGAGRGERAHAPAPRDAPAAGPAVSGAPADRGHLATEQRLPASARLDDVSIDRVLSLINDEDATVAGAVRAAIEAIGALVRRAGIARAAGGRLIYLGAGTSGRLGVLDASECPPTFFCRPDEVIGIIAGGDRALRRSVEGAEDDPDGAADELARLEVSAADLVVGIAAGGTTPYVLGALRIARERGAATGLICCAGADAARATGLVPAGHIVELNVGPEVLTGSTRMKAGTATKLTLNMISTATMVEAGKVWGNLMVDLRASNAKLRDRAARILARQCDLTRRDALAQLDRAGGRVKVALVMACCSVDADQACRLLDRHHQRLRPLLGPPRE